MAEIGEVVAGVKVEENVISETGASRSSRAGKGRFDLIPSCAIRRLALRYEGGAATHGDDNWKKGMSSKRCYDSALRHLFQWADGKKDEDHLGAVMWNIAALMYNEEHNPAFSDIHNDVILVSGERKETDVNH